jgi:NAD(P)-dependent dehydrogenase (short-subunit alcohol dehydrogenase family)
MPLTYAQERISKFLSDMTPGSWKCTPGLKRPSVVRPLGETAWLPPYPPVPRAPSTWACGGEVARWIALLLSPVSSFMTGAVIPLDGGQVIPHA